MNDVANTFLLVYASLFPIVNPVGGAPIFLAAHALPDVTPSAPASRAASQ